MERTILQRLKILKLFLSRKPQPGIIKLIPDNYFSLNWWTKIWEATRKLGN